MKEEVQRNQSAQNQLRESSFSVDKERFNSMAAQSFRADMKSFFVADENTEAGRKVIISKIEDKLLDNKYSDIIEILELYKDVNIMSLWDRKGLTLIHRMTLHMKIKEVQTVVMYGIHSLMNSQQKDKDILIKRWINFQNEEGFTALHYASFKGDIDIIRFLMEHGADNQLRNRNGLNVLHIAAQGDQPISLCYFDRIGVNLNVTDHKGGTALHWACYLGSENAVNYLVSKMRDQINTTDGEGLTPLHLAVISGNARVVKKLLQRGSDRTALDHNDKTPAQLAEENEYHNIQQMLEKTGGFQEYCNIKQPFKPMSKNPRQLLVLFLLLLLAEGSFISFIIPCFNYHYVELGIWAFILLGTLTSLMFAWRTNPGEVHGIANKTRDRIPMQAPNSNNSSSIAMINNETDKSQPNNNKKKSHIQRSNVNNSSDNDAPDLNSNLIEKQHNGDDESLIPANPICHQLSKSEIGTLDELIILYQKNEVSRICVECCIVKPKRSRHCEICKKCIRVYDHHCPWINNCVGAQNYKFFIMFILFMWLNMLSTLIFIFLHITTEYSGEEEHSDWIFNWYKGLPDSTLDILKIIKYAVSSLIIAVTLFFFVLHSILCFVQLSNLFLNQTTFERYNAHQPQQGGNDGDIDPQGPNQRSSQFKSDQSSTTENNPSIIQSNSRNLNANRNKLAQGQKKFSFANAYTMCVENTRDPQYDYAPPVRKSGNLNQQIARQQVTNVS